jgi:hypothetical protein
VTNAAGCFTQQNVQVTISPVPTLTVTNPAAVCPPNTVNLASAITSSTTGLTVTYWSGTTQLTPEQAAAIATSGTYTIRVTNAAGCFTQQNVQVTISPVPSILTVVGVNFCPPATTGTLTVQNIQAGVSYQVRIVGGATVGAPQSGTAGSNLVFTVGAGTYQIVATNASQCQVVFGNVTIAANPVPIVPTPTYVAPCPGTSTGVITIATQTGVNYQLTQGGTNIGSVRIGTGGNISFENLAAGSYVIVATNTTTLCTSNINATVSALTIPPCTATPTGPTNVCMGTTNTYSVPASACATNYQWTISGPCIIIGSVNSPTVNVKAIGSGNFTLTVTITYTDGTTRACPGLTVTSTPLAVNANDALVCPPPASQIVQLVGTPAGGVWASSNSQIQAAINNTNRTFNATGIPAGVYPVTYTVTNSDGCTGFDVATITVINNTVIGGLAGRVVANGSTGMEVTMNKSAKGIVYQLVRNGVKVGTPVEGTGGAINFGTQDVNGDYSVTASTQDGGCSTSGAAGRIAPSGDPATARAGRLDVSAYPNPFNDRISFTINSEYSGQGVLEVYNVLGAKIKTVYQGYINAGRSQTVDFVVPGAQRVNMIYKLRVGNHETSGKLINIK